MIIEIKIPSPGESISEVELANWFVSDGDYVYKDKEIGEIESDKATLPIIAEKSGKINIKVEAGSTIAVGDIACMIDTGAEAPKEYEEPQKQHENKKDLPPVKENKPVNIDSEKVSAGTENSGVKVTPLAKKLMEENNLNVDDILNGLKKITTKEVNLVLTKKPFPDSEKSGASSREESRAKMSQLRRKISERLVAVKNQTAMLTTFNEVNMQAVMEFRQKYQNEFVKKYGFKLGFMSFFTKAVAIALKQFPKLNSYIDGEEIATPEYYDIGIAVQTDKGLMVPLLRNVETMTIHVIEQQIAELANKARSFKLSPEEMSGGTFTITNGGVFGSLLSTPILNPPQSGILGMHNIVERPVALDNQVVIRPMMYIALSYDHRIVDGKESVSFLVKVKDLIETPQKLLFEDLDPDKALLGF